MNRNLTATMKLHSSTFTGTLEYAPTDRESSSAMANAMAQFILPNGHRRGATQHAARKVLKSQENSGSHVAHVGGGGA